MRNFKIETESLSIAAKQCHADKLNETKNSSYAID